MEPGPARRLPADLAGPADRPVKLRLTRDAQRQVRGGHPWVYEGSVVGASHDGAAGDLAVVFDDKRRFLAVGLYDPGSPIRLRVLHRGTPRTIDGTFWREALAAAFSRRAGLAATTDAPDGTTAYRLVHGENDGLPGLVVDRYDRTLVIKLDTAAWIPHLPALLDALLSRDDDPAGTDAGIASAPGPERIVLRLSRSVAGAAARVGLADGVVVSGPDPDGPIPFRENGLRFEADVVRGQKTGHFLDQRDNRARVGALAAGARVLDVFSCSGGFTVHAAAGGATAVHSVDASRHAIEAVGRHLDLNRERAEVARCRSEGTVGDAFTVMADLAARGRRYELVIVDPPAFAAKQADVPAALAAYRRLTRLALELTTPGGVLVQSSCSSRVEADAFFAAVHGAAAEAGHRLVELERTGHAVDHPVGFAQGAYLKTLFARVP